MTATEPVYMIVDAYLKADTKLHRGLEMHSAGRPCVFIRVGSFPNQFAIYFATVDDIDRFASVLADARQDLAEALGYLPNGDPCIYADLFGSSLWNEHDHDNCLTNSANACAAAGASSVGRS